MDISKKNKKPIFTTKRLTIIAIIVAVFAIVIPIIISEYKSDEELYKEYKEHYSELLLDSIKIKNIRTRFDADASAMEIEGVNYWIKLKNNTDGVITIRSVLTADYRLKDPVIRDHIKSKDTTNIEFITDTSFTTWVLHSKESRWFQIGATFVSSSPQNNNIHTCILYTNKFGGIYDLYFIQEAKYNIQFDKPLDFTVDTLKHKITYLFPPKMVEFTDKRMTLSPYIYTPDEVDFINDILKSIKEQ